MSETKLDNKTVAEALVNAAYSIEKAAEELGVSYMVLDAYIEEHPRLKGIMAIGGAPKVPAVNHEVAVVEKKPEYSEDGLRRLLSAVAVDGERGDNYIERANAYRDVGIGASDMVNASVFSNFMSLCEWAEMLMDRIKAGEYKSAKERKADYDAMTDVHKQITQYQKVIKEAELVTAKIDKIMIDKQFRKNPGSNSSENRPPQGRPGWKRKEKVPQVALQINSHGPTEVRMGKSKTDD